MRRLLFIAALLLWPLAAVAQIPGNIPAFSILGNPTSSAGLLTPLSGVLLGTGSMSLNVTAGGCTNNPNVRAPLFICDDNNGTSAAGYALGWQVWVGSNPTGAIAANDSVATFVYIDNTNGRDGIWAQNFNCNQVNVAAGGGAGINHCSEVNLTQSIVATTPLSGFSAGPVTHGYEAVCNSSGSASPFPCQVAFWAWAAGDYANNSSSATQPLNFAFAASRTQNAGFDCELISGDTGTYFKHGCVWDQSNSAASLLVSGTHTSIVDASGATYTQFANCNSICNFAGEVSSTGGVITTGNSGSIGLAASFTANAAVSGNAGIELQTVGVTRGYLAATGSLMELYTHSAIPLKLGTNDTDAIVISGSQVIQLPAVTTGTPTASLCIDASNNIVKKTTAGACI